MAGINLQQVPADIKKKYWYVNKVAIGGGMDKFPISNKGRLFTAFTFILGFTWITAYFVYEPLHNVYAGFGGLIAIAAMTGIVARVKTYKGQL
jgi:hypothetical protein